MAGQRVLSGPALTCIEALKVERLLITPRDRTLAAIRTMEGNIVSARAFSLDLA